MMLSGVVRVPLRWSEFSPTNALFRRRHLGQEAGHKPNPWTLCQPIAWFFSNKKHVWLQRLHAAGGQVSLTRPKGEKSVQQLIANENFNKPEKAEKQRQRKVCASQKSQELCDEGRVVA